MHTKLGIADPLNNISTRSNSDESKQPYLDITRRDGARKAGGTIHSEGNDEAEDPQLEMKLVVDSHFLSASAAFA